MFDLFKELSSYNPANLEENNNKNQIIQFLKTNTNCYDRSNLKGHITAGGLVVHSDGEILLNHHKKTGMWFQFGGHCDGNSDILSSAKREINEEAGIFNLKLLSNKIFDADVQQISYNQKKNEPEHFHYDINFLFLTDEKDFKVSNESSEIKWVTIAEAKRLINKDDKAMQRMLAKYENYLLKNKT